MINLIAFEIPESPVEIATWLESIICRGDLRGLVAQLNCVHGDVNPSLELDPFLGEHRQSVLVQGLSTLPESKVQVLLTTPRLLLDLQEMMMVEGGDYWQVKFTTDVGQDTVRRTEDAIALLLGHRQVTIDSTMRPPSRQSVFSLLALAAGLLVVIGGTWYWNHQGNVQEPVHLAAGWGWASESGIPSNVSPKDYLTALSNGADAWFNKRPLTQSELLTRLAEFSAGCEILVNSDHAPLNDADKAWLQYKCRGWKKQIDEQLATVNQRSIEDVLQTADNIARDISETLKERANRA